jgi:hypothetical protein
VNPRTTLILVVLAAALFGAVYWGEIRGADERREAEALEKQVFPDVEADAIEALAFDASDGQKVLLTRTDSGWRVAEPVDFPADDVAVDGLVSSLADLASEGAIDEPQAADVYGLGEAATRIQFEAAGREWELRVGGNAPVGGQTYVATASEAQTVYTVPTFRVTGFDKTLDDVREKLVLSFDRLAVVAIEADWPDGRVRLAKQGDAWQILEPLTADADSDTVESLLSDLSFLRADTFLDEPSEEQRSAADQAQFHVVLEFASDEGKEPERMEVTLGAVAGSGRVVRSSEQEILYGIPPERLGDFPRKLSDYRFKELARFSPVEAGKVELAFHVEGENQQEAVVIVAERGEDGWVSEPAPMSQARISRLVSELSRLTADEVLADALDEEALVEAGLSPPHTIVRVFGEAAEDGTAGQKLAEVFFGNGTDEGGILVMRPDRPDVYRLAYELAEHIPISHEAFQNRFVSDPEAAPAAEPAGLPGSPAPLE